MRRGESVTKLRVGTSVKRDREPETSLVRVVLVLKEPLGTLRVRKAESSVAEREN